MSETAREKWDLIIEPAKQSSWVSLKELLRYKDLISLFVKRDFVSLYKQTILGPIWVILQPILTTITFAIVFGKIAKIETGAPPILFYMAGVTCWTYFSDCVLKTSETFIGNQNLFGKVYFPRLVVPISVVLTNLIKFLIQFVLFGMILGYYLLSDPGSSNLNTNGYAFLLPGLVIIMAVFGMGTGLIISSLTTKYRDLRFLIQFGIQLAMFATPIVYPLKNVPVSWQPILQLNPMCTVIESIKFGFFGAEYAVFSWSALLVSFVVSMAVLFIGLLLFQRIERTFMDTI